MRKFGWGSVLVLGLLAAVAAVLWQRTAPVDNYDYARAFELPAAAEATTVQIDVTPFAGAPRAKAEVILGAPQRCEKALVSERCRYARGVEVVYIEGLADWITVQLGYARYALAPETLAAVGLPGAEPSVATQHELKWSGHAGFKSVQLVGDENGAMYVRIKALHG